jgi:hypothetical protein
VRVTAGRRRVPRAEVTLSYEDTRQSPQQLYDAVASETVGESAFVHARGANGNNWRVESWTWDPTLDRVQHPSSTLSLKYPRLVLRESRGILTSTSQFVYDWTDLAPVSLTQSPPLTDISLVPKTTAHSSVVSPIATTTSLPK